MYASFTGFCVILVLIQIFRKVLPWIYEVFIGPLLIGSKTNFRQFGEWALITGSTDGIGKEYAKAMARKGLNVVLVSRTQTKLENVAKEIEMEFNVRTKVIAVDFCKDAKIYEKIENSIAGLEIGVLINNVGMAYEHPEFFLELPDHVKFINDLINCNIASIPHMCRLVMPQMVDRGKGLVINISSLSGVIPCPLLTLYSASKAFVDKFSDDLAIEYSKNGIIIQSVLPGPVATNMSKIRKPNWMACSARHFVDSALRTVGISRHTTGFFSHSLLQTATGILFVMSPFIAEKLTLKTMLNVKRRFIKRAMRNK